MDVIGPMIQKASNVHEYILVAINYFTKWVEAILYKSVTQAVVAQFLKHNIICHYGVLGEVITDNRMNLNGKNDPETMPTIQDRAQKFGSLLPSDEWCSGSR